MTDVSIPTLNKGPAYGYNQMWVWTWQMCPSQPSIKVLPMGIAGCGHGYDRCLRFGFHPVSHLEWCTLPGLCNLKVNTCIPWHDQQNQHPASSLPSLHTWPEIHRTADRCASPCHQRSIVSSQEVVGHICPTASQRCEPQSAPTQSSTPPCEVGVVLAAHKRKGRQFSAKFR